MVTQRGRKGLILAAGAAVLSLALSACGASSDPAPAGSGGGESPAAQEPVELRMSWWGSDARHEKTNAALDLFEEKNPGITVVRDFGGFDGYLDKITTQYTGGNSPDVIQFYNEVLREFASRGQTLDLNDAVSEGNLSLDGWPKDLLETNTIDGALSALTFGLSTHAFIFDETKSAEYGVAVPKEDYTWDDLKTYATAISAASGGTVYGVTDLSHSYQVFEVYAKQNGEEFLTADGIGFTKDTLVDYWNYWSDMREAKAATPPDVTSEYPSPYDAVVQGTATSTFLFANQYAGVVGTAPNPLALMRMPGEGDTPGQYLRAAMNLIISSQSKHPAEAAKLVNFLLNDPEANAILGIDRGVPANADVVKDATADVDEANAKAIALIESVRENGAAAPVPAPTGSGTVNTMFAEFAQQVQFGKLSASDAADQFLAQAKSELG
ncbi:ABC transporter substrate-binding protein [Microbacterium sp. ZW T5_56]|uniref:ABC transporter substrate-binding protein n=1 Tax=Microbacterium sp. ZW T5_56 TaxID=3378081 RepID=UPI003852B9AD